MVVVVLYEVGGSDGSDGVVWQQCVSGMQPLCLI